MGFFAFSRVLGFNQDMAKGLKPFMFNLFLVLILSSWSQVLHSYPTIGINDPNAYFQMFSGPTGAAIGQEIEVGDITGDGITDFAVVAPDSSSLGRTGNGSVFVKYGPLNGPQGSITDWESSSNYNYRFHGGIKGGQVDGLRSVKIADLTGDGNPDLVIGGVLGSQGSVPVAGVTYVIPGPLSQSALTWDVDLNDSSSYQFRVDGQNYGLGWQLDVGDISGDGNPDLIASAAWSGSGYVYLIRGPFPPGPGAAISLTVTSNFSVRFSGNQASFIPELFGQRVRLGDVNGDGQNDLIISCPLRSTGGFGITGAVYAFYGPITWTGGTLINTATSTSFNVRFDGWQSGSFGMEAIIADLNSDGKNEIIVGDESMDNNAGDLFGLAQPFPSGTNNIIPVPTPGNYAFRIRGKNGTPEADHLGRSALVANLVGDNSKDLIIGARQAYYNGVTNVGKCIILAGPVPFAGTLIDLALTNTAYAEFAGDTLDAYFGSQLAAGDIENTGKISLFVSAPSSKSGDGRFYVISNFPTSTWTPVPETSPFEYEIFPIWPSHYETGDFVFSVKSAQNASGQFQVYNVAGELVASWATSAIRPGYNSVLWNKKTQSGLDVAPGIYLISALLKGSDGTERRVSTKFSIFRRGARSSLPFLLLKKMRYSFG